MCGIFCHIGRQKISSLPGRYEYLLHQRGPDSLKLHHARAGDFEILFAGSVLSLRGDLVEQPLVDSKSGCVFCWNGEAWKVAGVSLTGNDSLAIFESLLYARTADDPASAILKLFSNISGPYAFVFYDAPRRELYFGRDCLGRRSLLTQTTSNGDLSLSSVGDLGLDNDWSEIEADGMYMISMKASSESCEGSVHFPITHFPLLYCDQDESSPLSLFAPYPTLNQAEPVGPVARITTQSDHLLLLEKLLLNSLSLRLNSLPGNYQTPIAVLFSGGLDSTLLAYYSHVVLPPETPIDLINVAFQNPRVHRDTSKDPYSQCPDRITAKSAWGTLQRLCPSRQYRLICVDIPYNEFSEHVGIIKALMSPHNTEMDLSITAALYFASRAIGNIYSSLKESNPKPYTSPSRILLSGLGADELFAGYNRHAIAFSRLQFKGLLAELELDFSRLGRRNLGRDDRVTSHWSKEMRYPFLDEDVVAWAVKAPVWQKCGFGVESSNPEDGNDESQIEPGKLALRLLAWKVGMKDVAVEKKRAIQFGSRTAKMHSGRSKGTDALN